MFRPEAAIPSGVPIAFRFPRPDLSPSRPTTLQWGEFRVDVSDKVPDDDHDVTEFVGVAEFVKTLAPSRFLENSVEFLRRLFASYAAARRAARIISDEFRFMLHKFI